MNVKIIVKEILEAEPVKDYYVATKFYDYIIDSNKNLSVLVEVYPVLSRENEKWWLKNEDLANCRQCRQQQGLRSAHNSAQ